MFSSMSRATLSWIRIRTSAFPLLSRNPRALLLPSTGSSFLALRPLKASVQAQRLDWTDRSGSWQPSGRIAFSVYLSRPAVNRVTLPELTALISCCSFRWRDRERATFPFRAASPSLGSGFLAS